MMLTEVKLTPESSSIGSDLTRKLSNDDSLESAILVALFSILPEVSAVNAKFTIDTFGVTNSADGSSKIEQWSIKNPRI